MRKPDFNISFWRYKLLTFIITTIFVVILARLFQIQVINAPKYKALAREQQWHGLTLQAKRGVIYTSDGFPIATNRITYSAFVNPKKVDKTIDIYTILSEYIPNLDKDTIQEVLNSEKQWVKIATNIDWSNSKNLRDLKITGVWFEENYNRYYPENVMLSHVLGFVGKDQFGDDTGYYGLERYYNGDLQGQNGWLVQERSAGGDPILWGGVDRVDPIDGSDIYTTIDRNIQFLIQEKLEEGVKKHSAKSGVIVVVNPSTGEIIAMANYPYYNPALYSEAINDESIIRNDAISGVYEPGSVIKALTVAAGLDTGKINTESTYNDTGPRIYSGHKVSNWDGKHHGILTIGQILQKSNNMGAGWIGLQVGGEELIDYFKSFGFGSRLGIDLEGEERGILYGKFPLKDIELVNAAFGQGISATPLQVTMAFSAIANDGLLMKPYIVSKILSKDNKVVEFKPSPIARPISESTSVEMLDLLTGAASGGEAQFFVSKKYNIAGKTGTAQIPVVGGYDKNRTNATFVGFLTSYKNFVMLVKLEEPRSPSGYAAETAVPLWMDIAERLATYYGFPPDKQ